MNLHRGIHIAFTGLIGAGKSTLSVCVANKLGLPLYKEPVEENPYLAMFYADMKAHAFQMQIYLLTQRFRQQQHIVWTSGDGVQDRSIYEDLVFARMLTKAGFMSELDLTTYQELFWMMANLMRQPTMLVFLDVAPATALARIRERNRPCESDITLEYLTQLHEAYEQFLAEISQFIPVLRVDYERFHDSKSVVAAIQDFKQTTTTITRWPART